MTNGSPRPKRKRSARALAPGQRWRDYTLEMAEEIGFILPALEAAVTIQERVQMGKLNDEDWEYSNNLAERTLWQSVNSIDLAVLEYRDGFGKLITVIQGVAEPSAGITLSSNTWIYHKEGIMTLEEFFKNLHQYSHYLCLPGCDNSGDRATIEAFWARLAEWGFFPETRKRRVPPSAIFHEPEP